MFHSDTIPISDDATSITTQTANLLENETTNHMEHDSESQLDKI